MMRILVSTMLFFNVWSFAAAQALPPQEEEAIKKPALNYIEAGIPATPLVWKVRCIRN
jgi:hypothetical protein